jgi:hypothetical protein
MTSREAEWSRCRPSERGKFFRTAEIDFSCYFTSTFIHTSGFCFTEKAALRQQTARYG